MFCKKYNESVLLSRVVSQVLTYHLFIIHDVDFVERVALKLIVLVRLLNDLYTVAELIDVFHAQDEDDQQAEFVAKVGVLPRR